MDVGENTMKAYIDTRRPDWVLRRVVDALWRYAPDEVEIVSEQDKADLVVMHVIGRQDRTTREAFRILENGQRYAAIQYSVRSTLRPCTSGWLPIWRKADVVWSYYPLERWCAEDWTPFDFNFYHRPLGVDSEVFYPRNRRRKFIIGTSGHSAVTEGVREAAFASGRVGQPMFHLGPELKRGPGVVCHNNLDDEALAALLSRCHFVAGLRRTEGLELMAAEGLLCGARPICFDREHYRSWYAPWAIFIPETNRDGVIDNLETIFREGPIPVTEEERRAAVALFDWKRIIKGFWNAANKG
jgi:glycosyltransferase involved in cell wall biosynthesis